MADVILVFDPALFRLQFPAFANVITYPTPMLQRYWDTATCFVDDRGNYGWLQSVCRQLAINLMTAHLTALSLLIVAGQTPGYAQSATIDKVTVSLTPPPVKSGWQSWLIQTPYGAELWALLTVRSSGGWYVGGSPEVGAFRRVGGVSR